jgi:hypothetical protein
MIKWSFSGLKQYVNCARQFNEVKRLRNYQTEETEAMKYGTAVHAALEAYVRDGAELPAFYQRFKKSVDSLMLIPGTRYIEYKMALKEDKTPCDFDDPDYWVRGIVDLMMVNEDTAFIVDYKTGKSNRPDTKQLKLMALMTFIHIPKVQSINAALLFLMNGVFVEEFYKREDMDKYWAVFESDLRRYALSHQDDWWPANPSGLCRRHCPVDTCEFYGG